MMRSIGRVAMVVLAGGMLSACGDGGGSGDGGDTDLGNSGVLGIFGTNFDAAFNDGVVDVTANPNTVAPGDIIPISFTDDPVDIPNPS